MESIKIDDLQKEFTQNVEVDATLMFASNLSDKEFRGIATKLLNTEDWKVGFRRGIWFLTQPREYILACARRTRELFEESAKAVK